MYSIILATYNWPQALKVILDSLVLQLDFHQDVELVIADDGSSLETQVLINQYKTKITKLKHIWHEDTGFKKAQILNKAVAASSGEYLIFLDGDCVPFPDFILMHKMLLQKNYFVAGNRVLLSQKFTKSLLSKPDKLNQIFGWGLIKWVIARLKNQVNKVGGFIRTGNGWWRFFRKRNWKYPKGCNFALWRSDFDKVNGFDEEFAGWGHEDADLFIRLLHVGVLIKDGRFAIPVLHLWHPDSSRENEVANKARMSKRAEILDKS